MDLLTSVQNLPSGLQKEDYIVARAFQGELWYWGGYPTPEEAREAALAENGIVLRLP